MLGRPPEESDEAASWAACKPASTSPITTTAGLPKTGLQGQGCDIAQAAQHLPLARTSRVLHHQGRGLRRQALLQVEGDLGQASHAHVHHQRQAQRMGAAGPVRTSPGAEPLTGMARDEHHALRMITMSNTLTQDGLCVRYILLHHPPAPPWRPPAPARVSIERRRRPPARAHAPDSAICAVRGAGRNRQAWTRTGDVSAASAQGEGGGAGGGGPGGGRVGWGRGGGWGEGGGEQYVMDFWCTVQLRIAGGPPPCARCISP
jgi:hypothetical protein